MPAYVCENPDCDQHDIPKDSPQQWDDPVLCGACSQECVYDAAAEAAP